MPVCHACGVMDATVNLRRRRPPHTGEWACKDGEACKRRRKTAADAAKLNPGVQAARGRSQESAR